MLELRESILAKISTNNNMLLMRVKKRGWKNMMMNSTMIMSRTGLLILGIFMSLKSLFQNNSQVLKPI